MFVIDSISLSDFSFRFFGWKFVLKEIFVEFYVEIIQC